MQKIFLYGPPGSGKSTIGKLLAENLNFLFVDLDQQIEAQAGMSIARIMAASGEPAFRDAETAALRQACDGLLPGLGGSVIALGGGALLRPENRASAEAAGQVVFLEVERPILLSRLTPDESQRPLLSGDPQTRLVELLEKRREHYASFKCRVAITGGAGQAELKTPQSLAWDIQRELGVYHVRGMGQPYDVIVEPGGLDQLGARLLERGLGGPVLLVSDENIAPLYAGRALASLRAAGLAAQTLVIQPGEDYKTLETVAGLWRGMLEAGLDRKSTLVALGGGVVSDLAGFAASTFMRGCPWVVAPTTLLSMVDASLGGKTGFDLPEGKNLVGAFHSPRLVLADPLLLASLPEAELRSGLAEVVKHGVIADPELFEYCARGYAALLADLPWVVRRAIAVKVQIIEQDPFEKGLRAALNLGHTVGHAVEIVSEFCLRHGEAVAIGMVVEARLAEQLALTPPGLAQRIASVLAGVGLPVSVPANLSLAAILWRMKFDKKKSNNVVRFALPLKIGLVEPAVPLADLESIFSPEFLYL